MQPHPNMTRIPGRTARIAIACMVAILGLLASPHLAQAQGKANGNSAHSAPVRALLVPTLPDSNAPVIILHFAGARQPDMILLRASTASADNLEGAVALLRKVRHDVPDPSNDMRITMGNAAPPRIRDEAKKSHYRGEFEKLQHASPRAVTGYGSVPWIDVDLDK
ncbi:MAG: hypothetical protein JWO05_1891 [Gemmatimonadetes bacterium]|nr:hypothetical protein [Gemmatimonadota bacterium]